MKTKLLFKRCAGLLITSLCLFSNVSFAASFPEVQVIHNSPGAPNVDVWVNGTIVGSDIAYQQATGFLSIDNATPTTVQIAVTGTLNIVSTDVVNLLSSTSYRAIASGIVGTTVDGQGFKVYYYEANTSTSSGQVGLDIYHLSPGAPSVGVVARGVTTLVSAFTFAGASVNVSVPASTYTLDIRLGDAIGAKVTSFSAPISSLSNSYAAVIATGILGSTSTPFGLIAVTPNGTVIPLSKNAEVQAIHNSPGAPNVDVWVNGSIARSNVAYREATPFLAVSIATPTTVQIAVTGTTNIVSTDIVTLSGDSYYRAIATGIVGSTVSGSAFKVDFSEATTSITTGSTTLDIYHSSPNASTVGVVARGVGNLVPKFSYSDAPTNVQVPSASYTLDVNAGSSVGSTVASYSAPLGSFPSQFIAVVASGLLGDATTPFGLIAVAADGSVVTLPTATGPGGVAKVQVIHNSPGAPAVDVWINGLTVLSGVTYRAASGFLNVYTGIPTTVQIAVTGSNPYTIVSTDVLTLASQNYRAIASGVVGSTAPGQGFKVYYSAATTATSGSSTTGLEIIHSSPNAPAVGVVARGVATLVSSFTFGSDPVFVYVPSNTYVVDINAGSASGSTVASFTAPLSGLGDQNIAVIASGLLNDTSTPFGLIAVTSDGTVIVLESVANTVTGVATEAAGQSLVLYPNPASSELMLVGNENYGAEIYSLDGQLVIKSNQFPINVSNLNDGLFVVKVLSGSTYVSASKLTIKK